MVVAISLRELGDVRPDEPDLAALHADVGLGDVDPVLAHALDLGPGQHDASLEGLLDGVVVAGAPVDGDRVVGHRSLRSASGGQGSKGSGHGKSRPAGRLSLRYTTRSCVIAPPRWWRAWNYPSATPPPFVANDASGWPARRQRP